MAIAAAGAACVAYGTLIERRWYRLREVHLPGALRSGGPVRLLHVSDVHLVPSEQHLIDFLARVAEEAYDLVVLTGDLLGAREAEDAAVAALSPLTAGRPGLAVLGSNDLFAPVLKSPHLYFTDPDHRIHGPRLDTDRLVTGLEQAGYQVLRNATTTIRADGARVTVGAIDDPHLNDTVLPPIDAIAVEDEHADLRLGLVHAPYTAALDRLVDAGYDLVLAGHTHGGQVRFPPIGAVVANCDLPLRQIRGASRWREAWLHVSPGLGQSRFAPFRFACRPEATILHLTA